MSRWSDWLGGQARPQHSQVYLAMLLFGLIISLSTASAQSRVSVQAGFNSPYFGIATGNTGGFSQYGPYGGGYGSVGPSFYPGFGRGGFTPFNYSAYTPSPGFAFSPAYTGNFSSFGYHQYQPFRSPRVFRGRWE